MDEGKPAWRGREKPQSTTGIGLCWNYSLAPPCIWAQCILSIRSHLWFVLLSSKHCNNACFFQRFPQHVNCNQLHSKRCSARSSRSQVLSAAISASSMSGRETIAMCCFRNSCLRAADFNLMTASVRCALSRALSRALAWVDARSSNRIRSVG